jgi:hypothetical protein
MVAKGQQLTASAVTDRVRVIGTAGLEEIDKLFRLSPLLPRPYRPELKGKKNNGLRPSPVEIGVRSSAKYASRDKWLVVNSPLKD